MAPAQCITPSLPFGLFHVVIAAWSFSQNLLELPESMGLTNAQFFVYRREHETIPLRSLPGACGIQVTERLLLPNHGRDAAAFYDWAAAHRASPPAAMVFMHDHAGNSWHSTCRAVSGRTVLYYKELERAGVFDHMVTLTDKAGDRNVTDWFGGRRRLAENPPCERALSRHGVSLDTVYFEPRHAEFQSCCAMFIMPGSRLQKHPLALYVDLLNYVQRAPDNEWSTRQCFEYIIWKLMDNRTLEDRRRRFYEHADNFANC